MDNVLIGIFWYILSNSPTKITFPACLLVGGAVTVVAMVDVVERVVVVFDSSVVIVVAVVPIKSKY